MKRTKIPATLWYERFHIDDIDILVGDVFARQRSKMMWYNTLVEGDGITWPWNYFSQWSLASMTCSWRIMKSTKIKLPSTRCEHGQDEPDYWILSCYKLFRKLLSIGHSRWVEEFFSQWSKSAIMGITTTRLTRVWKLSYYIHLCEITISWTH